MGKLKWITGALGFVMSGPIGAIIGVAMGHFLEELGKSSATLQNQSTNTQYSRQPHNEFSISLMVLMAAVMKADGKVLKSELDYTKQYLIKLFGVEVATEAIHLLKDIIKQEIPVAEVAQQIGSNMQYAARVQLIHILFGLSSADGHIDQEEIKVIQLIAQKMKISSPDFQSVSSMFVADTNSSYKILEIDPKSTDDEVKKAYRKMAIKFHPDKVSYLGEEYQQSAKEKFQKVNQAYEAIKKERGIN